MAVSAYQTRGADDRCKEGHGRITRCPVLEGVAIQTGLSRSLGNPARNVTGKIKSLSKAERRKSSVSCFPAFVRSLRGVREIRAPFRKTVALPLLPEASWIRSVCPGAFRLTRKDNQSRMRCFLR